MADQAIPKSPPVLAGLNSLPPEWQMFFRELLRRVADLERRVDDLENP